MNEYLTPREVARLLQVNEKTVRRMVGRGLLDAIRVGGRLRIPHTEVARYMSEART